MKRVGLQSGPLGGWIWRCERASSHFFNTIISRMMVYFLQIPRPGNSTEVLSLQSHVLEVLKPQKQLSRTCSQQQAIPWRTRYSTEILGWYFVFGHGGSSIWLEFLTSIRNEAIFNDPGLGRHPLITHRRFKKESSKETMRGRDTDKYPESWLKFAYSKRYIS
jgi:hypothetical protein